MIDFFFQISNCTFFIEGVSKRINRPVFLLQKNVSDRAQYNDLQSLLCATLQVRIAGHVKTVFFDVLEVGIKTLKTFLVGDEILCNISKKECECFIGVSKHKKTDESTRP